MLNKPSQNILDTLNVIGTYVKHNNVHMYVHAPYTINLANAYVKQAYWNVALRQELEMADSIGAVAVIVHTGRYTDKDKTVAIANMAANITYVLEMVNTKCKLYLETPSGQGTELGVSIDELGSIWSQIPKTIRDKRMGICVDTCHIYAAGYDIGTRAGVRKWLEHFDTAIGIKYINLVHLNDSKNMCGSHLDRHAQLQHGKIGNDLGIIVRKFFEYKIPIVLETPGNYNTDVDSLKRWI